MKKFCVFLVICFFLSIFIAYMGSYARADDLGFTKTFRGEKYGTVTFDHLSHVNADCVGCHTEMKTAGGVTKELGHSFCKTCHKVTEGAPTKCKECHIR